MVPRLRNSRVLLNADGTACQVQVRCQILGSAAFTTSSNARNAKASRALLTEVELLCRYEPNHVRLRPGVRRTFVGQDIALS